MFINKIMGIKKSKKIPIASIMKPEIYIKKNIDNEKTKVYLCDKKKFPNGRSKLITVGAILKYRETR
jgi:hypothetical protein